MIRFTSTTSLQMDHPTSYYASHLYLYNRGIMYKPAIYIGVIEGLVTNPPLHIIKNGGDMTIY